MVDRKGACSSTNPLGRMEGTRKRPCGKPQLRIDGRGACWPDEAVAARVSRGEAGAIAPLFKLVMGPTAGQVVVAGWVAIYGDEGRLFWIPDSKTEAGKRTLQVPDLLRDRLLALAEGKKSDDLPMRLPRSKLAARPWSG